jgi:hypothetical protein
MNLRKQRGSALRHVRWTLPVLEANQIATNALTEAYNGTSGGC